MSENYKGDTISPWHPITEPIILKHLGKLCEEVNELGQIISRIIIQGVNELNPDTGIPNIRLLENEIADVLAGIDLIKEHLSLNHLHIEDRRINKRIKLREWHKMA